MAAVGWAAGAVLAVVGGGLVTDPELDVALIRPVAGIGILWVTWAHTALGRALAGSGVLVIAAAGEVTRGTDLGTAAMLLAGLAVQVAVTVAVLHARDRGWAAWVAGPYEGVSLVLACTAGAAASAALTGLLAIGIDSAPPLTLAGVVLLRNLVGALLVVGCYRGLHIHTAARPEPLRRRDLALTPIVAAAVTAAALASPLGIALGITVLPITVWTAWRLGMRWSTVHVISVTFVVGLFAAFGDGPLLPGATPLTDALVAQTFVGVLLIVAGGSALIQHERDLATAAEHDIREELAQLALYDALTGLPNRTLLNDRLQQTLASSRRTHDPAAVLFLDLDRFKDVNDRLGHRAGDELLQQVADRIRAEIRPQDTVARISGDEFVLLCPGLDADTAASTIGTRLIGTLHTPFHLDDGETVTVGVSVGLVDIDPEESAEVVLARADAAMYAAKSRGRGRLERFDQQVEEATARRLALSGQLAEAVGHDQFALHFQPVVSLRSGEVIGTEALVRWQHPTDGLLLPGDWLDVMEDSHAILDLSRWVIDRACHDAARHLCDGPGGRPLTLHVNISPRHLLHGSLVDDVRTSLEHSGWSADHLVLEITETRLTGVDRTASQRLRRDLRELATDGVRIALDDFGSGASSLDQLVELPVQLVKIDRSFVHAVATEPRAHSVVRGILSIATALDLVTVAEGVETTTQADVLRELGCLDAQGFLWAPATPVDDLQLAAR